jgi:hypothetical protein
MRTAVLCLVGQADTATETALSSHDAPSSREGRRLESPAFQRAYPLSAIRGVFDLRACRLGDIRHERPTQTDTQVPPPWHSGLSRQDRAIRLFHPRAQSRMRPSAVRPPTPFWPALSRTNGPRTPDRRIHTTGTQTLSWRCGPLRAVCARTSDTAAGDGRTYGGSSQDSNTSCSCPYPLTRSPSCRPVYLKTACMLMHSRGLLHKENPRYVIGNSPTRPRKRPRASDHTHPQQDVHPDRAATCRKLRTMGRFGSPAGRTLETWNEQGACQDTSGPGHDRARADHVAAQSALRLDPLGSVARPGTGLSAAQAKRKPEGAPQRHPPAMGQTLTAGRLRAFHTLPDESGRSPSSSGYR